MQRRKQRLTAILPAAIAILTATSSAACAAGPKRPEPKRYTVCFYFNDSSFAVCNQDGTSDGNFLKPLSEMDGYRMLSEDDFTALTQELFILRNKCGGRKGD